MKLRAILNFNFLKFWTFQKKTKSFRTVFFLLGGSWCFVKEKKFSFSRGIITACWDRQQQKTNGFWGTFCGWKNGMTVLKLNVLNARQFLCSFLKLGVRSKGRISTLGVYIYSLAKILDLRLKQKKETFGVDLWLSILSTKGMVWCLSGPSLWFFVMFEDSKISESTQGTVMCGNTHIFLGVTKILFRAKEEMHERLFQTNVVSPCATSSRKLPWNSTFFCPTNGHDCSVCFLTDRSDQPYHKNQLLKASGHPLFGWSLDHHAVNQVSVPPRGVVSPLHSARVMGPASVPCTRTEISINGGSGGSTVSESGCKRLYC